METGKAAELLPCPFCGGKPFSRQVQTGVYSVMCGRGTCMVEGSRQETEAEAIAAWNTRAALLGDKSSCQWRKEKQV